MTNGKHRQDPVDCSVCGGSGEIQTRRPDREPGSEERIETITCPGCNGTGKQP